jgi:hypothetical protein
MKMNRNREANRERIRLLRLRARKSFRRRFDFHTPFVPRRKPEQLAHFRARFSLPDNSHLPEAHRSKLCAAVAASANATCDLPATLNASEAACTGAYSVV